MKTKLFLGLTAGLLLVTSHYKAQVSAYTFTQSLSSYGAANTGSFVGVTMQDDDVTLVNLPFAFVYNGVPHSTINVCSNGYLSFNALNGSEYTPISDATTQNLISPFGQDLVMGSIIFGDITSGSNTITNCSSVGGYSVGNVLFDYGNDFGGINPTITAVSGSSIVVNINASNTSSPYVVANTHGYIKQNTSGTAPNRVCEFEYANFSRSGTFDEVLKFKVRLFETSNRIEFVYGNMFVGTDVFPSEVGLKGNSNSDFNSRRANTPTTWSNSIASTLITHDCDFETTNFPLNGQSYMWAPASCTVPVLAITPSNSITCSGQSVTLTVSGATSYTWANGSSTTQLVLAPTQTATYTVVGANLTCTSSLTYTQNIAPSPSLNITQTKTLICAGQTTSLNASGASSYTWNGAQGSAQLVISPTVTTTYSLIGSNGTCTAQQSIVQNVQNCTGIAETGASQLHTFITAFPNPFRSELSIKNSAETELSVSILDALGKTLYSAKIKPQSVESFNSDFLNSGIYFITVKDGNTSVTKKIIKE
jgi:hypothetical protein